MTLQAFVRKMSPSAYKMAVRLRHSGVSERMMHMPSRLRARQLFRTGVNLTVTISGRMGLGGIFTNAANALAAGQAYGIDLDLRFTSPTYAPSWNHANSDWLEDYFIRYRPAQLRQAICDVRDIPYAGKATTLREKAELVWSYMGIQQKFADRASKYIPSSPFAAVHFRGSDKFLDAAPVQMKTVLDVVEANLRVSQLEKLFVASDEPHFLDLCHARFGSAVFAIPLQAVATPSGTPAHFTDVVGEIKASEALETMLVLSRAKVLVKTESLLSDWATTLSDDQRVIVVRHSAERIEAAAQISRFGQRLS
jgi:hypothetical protein